MINRGPNAISPAAKTPGAVVISVVESIFGVPCRVTSMPSEGFRNDRSEACPIARITVSQGIIVSVPGKRRVEPPLDVKHRSALHHFQPTELAVLAHKLFGTKRGPHHDSFRQS